MELHTGLIELNWTCVMILINVFILYIVLKKFFWEKIKAFMDERSNSIQDAIDAAEAMNKRADLKMEGYNQKISKAEDEGREIIKAAKQQADFQAQLILNEARQQASDIIAIAEKTIETEREKALEDMRQEIASIGILVAEQIVGREIEVTGQDAMIDEAIKKVRSTQWQN